jgi:hypothetical protein
MTAVSHITIKHSVSFEFSSEFVNMIVTGMRCKFKTLEMIEYHLNILFSNKRIKVISASISESGDVAISMLIRTTSNEVVVYEKLISGQIEVDFPQIIKGIILLYNFYE